mmetsp:Transcript_5165/g.9070  ORF Transcript_5165/g.9070 Transcript_5165/m.9070 type:complete len:375 (-) Transcript_5165:297-1421(-)
MCQRKKLDIGTITKIHAQPSGLETCKFVEINMENAKKCQVFPFRVGEPPNEVPTSGIDSVPRTDVFTVDKVEHDGVASYYRLKDVFDQKDQPVWFYDENNGVISEVLDSWVFTTSMFNRRYDIRLGDGEDKYHIPARHIVSVSERRQDIAAGIQCNHSSYQDALGQIATVMQPVFEQELKSFSERFGVECVFAPVKTRQRMLNKLAADHSMLPRPRAAENTDVLRGTIIFNKAEDFQKFRTEFCKSYRVLREKNGYANKTSKGFRSCLVNFLFVDTRWENWKHMADSNDELLEGDTKLIQSIPEGPVQMVVELQLVMRQYWDARAATHTFYEVARAEGKQDALGYYDHSLGKKPERTSVTLYYDLNNVGVSLMY